MLLIYNNHLRINGYEPWKFHFDPSSGLRENRRQTDSQTDTHTDTQTNFGWGLIESSKLVASLAVWNKHNQESVPWVFAPTIASNKVAHRTKTNNKATNDYEKQADKANTHPMTPPLSPPIHQDTFPLLLYPRSKPNELLVKLGRCYAGFAAVMRSSLCLKHSECSQSSLVLWAT